MTNNSIHIGDSRSQQIQAGSHDWATTMNNNLIKSAVLNNGAVLSRTKPIPDTASNGDIYINPATSEIWTFLNGVWYIISPVPNQQMYVADEDVMVIFNAGWKILYTLSTDNPKVPRELNIFIKTGYPGTSVFTLAPSLEFSYVSGQVCPIIAETAGTASFQVIHTGINGQISQPAGLDPKAKTVGRGTLNGTTGTLTFTESGTVLSALTQGKYAQPDRLTVICTAWSNAENVSISLYGRVRGLHDG